MRTHLCGKLDDTLLDSEITVSGWVQNRRDHGGVIFIDLRDRSGRLQVVADPDYADTFSLAEQVRSEYVLTVKGKLRARPEGTINEELSTGKIELLAHELVIQSKSEPLPFIIEDDEEIGESTRLKYRFLDLRRPAMQNRMRLRHQITSNFRRFLDERDFVDIETPVLTRSTPEGARDYLVPSRTHPGEFFALPQSPQLFKQLLMVAGFERYYQIARCFRDEDLRADRQPEFTQLDVEMSFVDEEDVMETMEQMIRQLFLQVIGETLADPIPRMSYHEAMHRFGVDRPDLRIEMELVEVADLLQDVEFKVFAEPAKSESGRVAALCVPGGSSLSRAQIDQYTDYVKQFKAKGLAYIKVNDIEAGLEGLQSPILKFLPPTAVTEILSRTNAKTGDLIFFGADQENVVNNALGSLRLKVADDLGLVQSGWRPLWVVDFPLVEWDEDSKRWQSLHHPFTAPKVEHEELLESAPAKVLSRAYDLVLNGTEIGGGSIRIHRSDLQSRILQLLNIGEEEAQEKFGFLLQALKFGAPPHGGIAFGVDRVAAMMSGVDSIRDVIAFPKTQKASCLLTEAPGEVDSRQLKELGIRVAKAPIKESAPQS